MSDANPAQLDATADVARPGLSAAQYDRAMALLARYREEVASIERGLSIALRRGDGGWIDSFTSARVRHQRAIARVVHILQVDAALVPAPAPTIPAPAWSDEDPTCDDLYPALVSEDRPVAAVAS